MKVTIFYLLVHIVEDIYIATLPTIGSAWSGNGQQRTTGDGGVSGNVTIESIQQFDGVLVFIA